MSLRNSDGVVSVVVPDGQTFLSGQIQLAADGRLGVVVAGPARVGVADGSVTANLRCAVDDEVEVTTTLALVAGPIGCSVDVATQTIVGAGVGTKDVRLVLYPAIVGSKARVVLN